MANPAVEWYSINDFTPGIHERLSPTYKPGTAQRRNTYRCHALEGGALAPLPMKWKQDIRMAPPVDPGTILCEEFRIIGAHIIEPAYWSDTIYGLDQNNSVLILAVEYHTAAGRTYSVYRYDRHRQNPTWTLMWSDTVAVGYNSNARPGHLNFLTGRSNKTDYEAYDGPTVCVWVGDGYAQMYPDDLAPLTNGTRYLPGDRADPANTDDLVSPDQCVIHQGRLVIWPLVTKAFGPNTLTTHNESLYWTEPNNFRDKDPISTWYNTAYGEDYPIGYEVIASLSSQELIMIKRRGGAILVQGDLGGALNALPKARALPFVRSTGYSMCNGTMSPNGYTYPVDGGGVWLWQGGDFSEHLTKHLEPDFWRPEAKDRNGDDVPWGYQHVECDNANAWVYYPNNWVWDTDINSWWRTDNVDHVTAYRWVTDWRGRKAYAVPRGFRDASDPVIHEYDLTEQCASYSWQSQPIATTLDSTVTLMDVAVAAKGDGRIDITVSSAQDPIGHTKTFYPTAGDFASVERRTFGVRGTHLTIRAQAYSDDGESPAPTIGEIRYSLGVPTPI